MLSYLGRRPDWHHGRHPLRAGCVVAQALGANVTRSGLAIRCHRRRAGAGVGRPEAAPLQLFYVLFLPIVWMALRGGLEGVTIGLLLTQLGLIVGVTLSPAAGRFYRAANPDAGVDRDRSHRRRARHRAPARRSQAAVTAESTGPGGTGWRHERTSVAIAHELNQPLTAARTYARLVADAAREDGANSIDIAEIAAKAVAQVERAAQVVRSLRSLLSLDRGNRLACSVERLIREALALCEPELDQVNAKIRVAVPSRLPAVWSTLCKSSKLCSTSSAIRSTLSRRLRSAAARFRLKRLRPARGLD